MNDFEENFGDFDEDETSLPEDGKMKCYNKECNNRFFYEEKDSCFCSDECKASYHGTTIDKLDRPVPKKNKRSLEEWIAYFKSPEAKAIYHERQKGVKIEKNPNDEVNTLEDAIGFFSTPLGAEYVKQSRKSSGENN